MLSVVIPTLNEAKYLPGVLASLKKQTFADFEVIVADAASTDGTREIALGHGCHVVQGGTISQGRNAGARRARGKYLLFLDADVTVAPDFLEELMFKVRKKNWMWLQVLLPRTVESCLIDSWCGPATGGTLPFNAFTHMLRVSISLPVNHYMIK